MVIGVGGLALGFLAGGLALAGVLGIVLQRSVDAEIDSTARQVATLAATDALPVPIPVPAGDQVQVVDAQGRVRAASADADPLVPMLAPDDLARLRAGAHLTIHSGGARTPGGQLRVAGVDVGTPGDPRTVIVGRSTVDTMRGLGLLRTQLLVLFPLLLLASGLVAWRVIGAALRPVEQLRRGAEEITGAGAGAASRLPVPAGHDEIHRLALTLNGMLDRLESARNRQREFVADAAHELRSPLASMRAQLEVAQRLAPGTDWSAVSDDLLTDTTRLSRLVDDLLLLARADAAAPPSRVEPVELTSLLAEVAVAPNVRVAVGDPVWTVGAPDELYRIVANLVDNAVRHARTGVEVATRRDGDRAVVTVTDDGPGIAPVDRERVFERFTRLDDSRTAETGGAGLGLAIVRELVRRHGGTVTLADANPSGDPDAPGPGLDALAAGPGLHALAAGPGLRVEVRLPAAEGS
ncbi:MAG TPA: HAMP domain-containing sensor histidine kinase [Micromonosporaceae bacterium]